MKQSSVDHIDKTISGIYIITNLENNKIYIGKSQRVRERLISHFADLSRNEHPNKGLQEDYNKGHNFKCEILQNFNEIKPFISIGLTEKLYMYEFFCQGYNLYNYNDLKGKTKDEQLNYFRRIITNEIIAQSPVMKARFVYEKRINV